MPKHVIDGAVIMVELGIISPLLFSDFLILSLTKNWLEKFSGIPEFNVSIDKKGHLCITSVEEVKDDVV